MSSTHIVVNHLID